VRLDHSREILDLRRGGGLEAVQRYLAQTPTRPGVSLQARVRDLARDMKSAEIRLLNERENDARRSARVAQTVIVVGSALALTFVGFAIFAIRRDFAGRARAETELTRFFDLSLDMLAIAGADGYFKRVSPAVAETLGYNVEEILQIPYMDLVHPDDLAASYRVLEKRGQGESVSRFDARARHKDGSWRTISWRSAPSGDLIYCTARDVTDSVRTELELRAAKEQLEARVVERTRALAESIEALQLSERRFRALIEHSSDGNGAGKKKLIDTAKPVAFRRLSYVEVKEAASLEPRAGSWEPPKIRKG